MTLYDVVTLTVKIGANAQVFEILKASGDQAGSTLLFAEPDSRHQQTT